MPAAAPAGRRYRRVVVGRGVGRAVGAGTGLADAVGTGLADAVGTGLADAVGAGATLGGAGTGVASSSLPASGSPGGSVAPGGSGTGRAVALGTGTDAEPERDGAGTGVALDPPGLVGDETGTGVALDPPGLAGDGVGVAARTCGAGAWWACPVAAIAAVPPPRRASPVTPAITQARLTRGRLLLDCMCFSRMRLWFVGGKYGQPMRKLCRRGRNLTGRSAVYARAGEQKREGYVG